MKYGKRRHLLSFPGKIVAYTRVWPDLADKAIECISILASGRSRIDEKAFYDEETRVPHPLISLAQTFLYLVEAKDDRRKLVHYEDFVKCVG